MSKIWLPGGGGGTDLDVVTAGAGDILAGKVIVGSDGEPLTGTLALTGTAADSQVLAGQTYYNTDAKAKRTGSMVNRGAVSQSLGINGSYTIPAGYHNGSGKVTQSIPTRGAATITPRTTNQTAISAGYYASGNVIVEGDPNLIAANIIRGKTIFGVAGTAYSVPVGPSDLYNRGINKGGLIPHDGNATFNTSQISMGTDLYNLEVEFSVNFTSYSRLNVTAYIEAANYSSTCSLYQQKVGWSRVSYAGFGNAGQPSKEFTVALDISSLQVTGKFYIKIKKDINEYFKGSIRRVWLS